MIASNVLFKQGTSPQGLFMEAIQVPSGTINITSINSVGWDKFKQSFFYTIILASTPPANSIAAGMDVVVSGTNNHDGNYLVKDINGTTLRVYSKSEHKPDEAAGGTVTAGGICEEATVLPGTVFKNNKGNGIFNTYQSSGSFIVLTRNDANPVIQVTELGTSGVSVTITFSLDRVNWLPLPTPISGVGIGAGSSAGFILSQFLMTDVYIKIDIAAGANSNYYVLVK